MKSLLPIRFQSSRQVGWARLGWTLCLSILAGVRTWGAFGLTTATDYYTVDTGAGLVFKVRRVEEAGANPNTISIGDIRSLVYNGVEYQDTARGSQINSGFDYLGYGDSSVTVTAAVVNTDYIKVTVTTANLIHYYVVRNGYPHIYMATYFNVQPVTGGGLCRYIVRMPYSLLPNGPPPSDLSETTYTVESGDVFGQPNGETRSKHYSNQRLMDWFYTGATGNGAGVFMMRGNQEGGSGGPFFRCLINQGGGDQEVYEIINYGEAQTEAFRTGILNGPYTLVFNNGQLPTAPLDYSWLESAGLNLTNFVPLSSRGAVKGTVSGVSSAFQAVVGFANTNAQYWTVATNGSYTTPAMIPGTYTVTLYKQELAVATTSVAVSAGNTNTLNLASTEPTPNYIWKLGEWDGTPAGFLNADKLTYMHPSDVRMAGWAPGTYFVETNNPSQFPCVQFRGANSPGVIKFNLTAGQIGNLTLRLGTTCAYNNGRPRVTLNGWVSAIPSAPSQPSTRSITVGTYRENNILYTYNIPSSALLVGENTLSIDPVSGSGDLGTFLSASWAYDCIELDGTPIAPLPPTDIAATLNASRIGLSWPQVFNAVSYRIKRSTSPGGPYTNIGTNGVARFEDTNAMPGLRYYYVVSSVNAAGESPNSQEEVAGVAPAPVVHLPFDENAGTTASDASGLGWQGTLLGGAGWNTGQYGSAANLNGTSGYVSLPAGVVSTLGDFTIAAWVNLNAVSTWSRVFDFGNDTISYMFLTPQAGGSGKVRFAITVGSGGGEQQIEGTGPLPTGWHHVAVTHEENVGVLYVDGVAVGTNNTMTLKPSDLHLTTQNYIGRSQWPDPYLNGRVDDFRVYSGALAAAQIAALVSSPRFGPANLTATPASPNQIDLTWNAAAGAVDYVVQRSTTNGGPYTTIASSLTATNYSDTGLTADTTYYYQAGARDANGATINSAQAPATTPAGPAAPQGLAALSLTPGQVDLSWNASPAATGYVVKRTTISGGPYLPLGTTAATRFTDTNVTGGFTYSYVVASLDAAGEGVASTEASTLALPTLAAYLKFDEGGGTLAADSSGHGWNGTLINGATRTAGVSNNAVSFNSASSQYATLPAGVVGSLNDFTIAAWVNLSSTANWNRILDFGYNTTSYMFLTPQSGATGKPRFAITIGSSGAEQGVDGINAIPAGGWHHLAVTLSGTEGILYLDGVPQNTNNAIMLHPSSLGSTLVNYLGRSQWPDPYLNGRLDEFRIYSGALSAGEVATFITPLTAPGLPVAQPGDGEVALSWNASANAVSYQVLRSQTDGGPYALVATVASTNLTDFGVLNGLAYFYVIKAVNSAGSSPASVQVSANPTSTAVISVDFSVTAGMLELEWPPDHTGWVLQSQTNAPGTGLGDTWYDLPDSSLTNQLSLPMDAGIGSLFFRLRSP